MNRLTRDGTAEPVSRDQILRGKRGQESIHIPCSADHEQDWQPYPVDLYSATCDGHTNMSKDLKNAAFAFAKYSRGMMDHVVWDTHRLSLRWRGGDVTPCPLWCYLNPPHSHPLHYIFN